MSIILRVDGLLGEITGTVYGGQVSVTSPILGSVAIASVEYVMHEGVFSQTLRNRIWRRCYIGVLLRMMLVE
jgi:hypothetical protein